MCNCRKRRRPVLRPEQVAPPQPAPAPQPSSVTASGRAAPTSTSESR